MKKIISYFLIFNFILTNLCQANSLNNAIQARHKHPCYHEIYLNEDKYETLNRKIFEINLKLNKIFVKHIHTLWASILPNFMIDSLNRVYNNIEYPKKIVSCLLQRDFDAIKHVTKRFIINTTIGIVGAIDIAEKYFNLEKYNEDIEQALACCKMKCGSYLVLPFLSSTTSRDITGRIFDFLLNPTTYIATPVMAIVKMGLLVNRTSFIQPIIKMVESNFADPYDIARKFYGVEKHIKLSNYDREKVLTKIIDSYREDDFTENQTLENLQVKGSVKNNENLIVDENINSELYADIFLNDYNPQNPITDSMRTALFNIENKKHFWSETSIWNRSFKKKIKKAEIEISKNREKYTIRYILQKNKTSPLAILIPSVGEGVNNNHSNILAELFYKEGYSVLIIGNFFQWEFLKSIEKGHKLGLIKNDVKYINKLLNNSIKYLSEKYDRVFLKRTVLGTSLGAYAALFLANEQYETGGNNIDKFIAICPPHELTYAIEKMDNIIDSWNRYPNDLKEKIATTSARVMRAYKNKEKISKDLKNLPFTNFEAKLISAYVFHQKLSDLIYTIEVESNENINKKELYEKIYNSNFRDYIEKYILVNHTYEDVQKLSSLNSISNYLINNDNYKIYHSLDDYLTNKMQLRELKSYCDKNLILFSNGAHLGFLYRKEFIDELKKEIKI